MENSERHAEGTFKCKNCGTRIKAPIDFPTEILGAGIGEFKVEIRFDCEKCRKQQQTFVKGKILIDLECEIKVKR